MGQALPIALTAAGALTSAGGTIIGANNQASALRSEAGQLERQAGVDRASGQRAAIEQRRQARLLASRALAVGAATGGAMDPTVVNALARLEGEGEYRSLVALYEGEERARGAELQASARRKEAKNARTAGLVNAAGTLLQAGGSMYERFGR